MTGSGDTLETGFSSEEYSHSCPREAGGPKNTPTAAVTLQRTHSIQRQEEKSVGDV